jgi:hypothetical protein
VNEVEVVEEEVWVAMPDEALAMDELDDPRRVVSEASRRTSVRNRQSRSSAGITYYPSRLL